MGHHCGHGQSVSGIVADQAILAWVLRFLETEAAIKDAYLKAGNALQERLTEVVITSASFEGGGTAGQLSGDPRDMMEACEVALQYLENGGRGDASAAPATPHFNFSKRRVGT